MPSILIANNKNWQAEDDMRTLMRAEEIQKDKTRLSMAAKLAAQKAKEAQKVASMAKLKGKK